MRAAAGEILVVTADEAVWGPEVRIADGRIEVGGGGGGASRSISMEQAMVIRFDARPRLVPARAWVCLQDGRRLSGDGLTIEPGRIAMTLSGGRKLEAELDDVAGVFFKAREPRLADAPETGVAIVSANGDVLRAPFAELTEAGAFVEINADLDPVVVPRDRLAAVLWPAKASAASPDGGAHRVELRTGEQLTGRVESLDDKTLHLSFNGDAIEIDRREIRTLWLGQRDARLVDAVAGPENDGATRPAWRIDRNALGGPFRIGGRSYERGIGLRGPAEIRLAVPDGARWLLAAIGADADAASAARMTLELLVDAKSAGLFEHLIPGEPARVAAVRVGGASQVTIRLRPDGDDATGCLADVADAVFIE